MGDRNKLLYVIDLLMLFSFIGVFVTGIMKWPGLLFGLGIELDYFVINKIHEYSGLTMGLVALAHISLHWNWLVVMTKKYRREGFFRSKQIVKQPVVASAPAVGEMKEGKYHF